MVNVGRNRNPPLFWQSVACTSYFGVLRIRGAKVITLGLLLLGVLLAIGGTNTNDSSIYYSKNYKMMPRTHSQKAIVHEHLVNCTRQQQEHLGGAADGINVRIYNPRMAPAFAMNVHPGIELISQSIRGWGCFECGVLQRLLQFLARTPTDTFFLDLGGNIGMYSLHAAALGREVYTFEPVQTNYQRICRSIGMNPGFENLITVFDVALTETPSTVQFAEYTKNNMGGIRVQQALQHQKDSAVKGVDYAPGVPLSQFANVLPSSGRSVVIKIDVEEMECNALSGAMDYLNTLDILYVQIEWAHERLIVCQQRVPIFQLFRKNRLVPFQYYHGRAIWERLNVEKWDQWRNHWFLEDFVGYPVIDIAWVRED